MPSLPSRFSGINYKYFIIKSSNVDHTGPYSIDYTLYNLTYF